MMFMMCVYGNWEAGLDRESELTQEVWEYWRSHRNIGDPTAILVIPQEYWG